MTIRVSVLISTHNPRAHVFTRVLHGLRSQTLHVDEWELVLVDNASTPPVTELGLPSLGDVQLRHVREDRLGLIYGRIAGLRNSTGPLVVFCDDDTILSPEYLQTALQIFEADATLGVANGRSAPDFAIEPQPWVTEFFGCLAIRNYGSRVLTSRDVERGAYPHFAGGGGGAVFRRTALESFLKLSLNRSFGASDDEITGRRGTSLASGEDNDIVLSLIECGWVAAYVPDLLMTHVIHDARLGAQYLGRLNHGIARSWVQVLDRHGIRPWSAIPRWTVPLRKGRAFLTYRAWVGRAHYVRWMGACGNFEGRAAIPSVSGRYA